MYADSQIIVDILCLCMINYLWVQV